MVNGQTVTLTAGNFLPAGTYTLTRAGTNEDAAATGDLDITQNLTITGAGAATTIIDGNQLDRVFQNHGATVTISGVPASRYWREAS